ncbi:MAG: flavodoxin domain-containing protein, partial [Duncaniella sp.]|nr:flavodoxin domain-containing protein [Duncaniella sp.]
MTVIYFTATGNSLAVAKHIAGRCISAVALLQQTGPIELSDPEGIGFVMPVYFGQIPAVITQLMRRVSLRAPYLFAVLTYGELAGRAATHMRRLGEETGIRFDYIRSIKMVDNNFTIVSVSRQVRDCGRKKIPACMDAIAGEIRARKCFVEKPGVVSRLIGIIEERMPQGSKFDSGLSGESDKCKGCGTCVRV